MLDYADVVDHLRIDVLRRAEDRQARPTQRLAPDARARALEPPLQKLFRIQHGDYFFLPSLRRMVSVEYLMPLPL